MLGCASLINAIDLPAGPPFGQGSKQERCTNFCSQIGMKWDGNAYDGTKKTPGGFDKLQAFCGCI